MTCLKYPLLALALAALILTPCVHAVPSSGFEQKGDGDWYDSFSIDRNRYEGEHGYLPRMAYETVGVNAATAYNLGTQFKQEYADTSGRAEAILKWVQKWTEYGYDSESVTRDGAVQDEWAWNADETASRINQDTGVTAIGDCEDLAFFCATLYTAAGIDAAVVDCPDHVGCLIWLPDYPNADLYFDLQNDNRGAGWIWVESTGSTNRLGWTPPDYEDGNWNAYIVSATGSISDEPVAFSPNANVDSSPGTTPQLELPIDWIVLGVLALIIVLALAAAGSRRKSSNQDYQYPPPPPPPPPGWG